MSKYSQEYIDRPRIGTAAHAMVLSPEKDPAAAQVKLSREVIKRSQSLLDATAKLLDNRHPGADDDHEGRNLARVTPDSVAPTLQSSGRAEPSSIGCHTDLMGVRAKLVLCCGWSKEGARRGTVRH